MRDPEKLLELLREMAASSDGRIMVVRTMDPGSSELCHQMELLADAGLIEWNEPKLPRITNTGYDFIEGVDKNPKCMTRFLEKLQTGIPLIQAAKAALELLV